MNQNQQSVDKLLSAIDTILPSDKKEKIIPILSENLEQIKAKISTLTDESLNEIKKIAEEENLNRIYELISSIK